MGVERRRYAARVERRVWVGWVIMMRKTKGLVCRVWRCRVVEEVAHGVAVGKGVNEAVLVVAVAVVGSTAANRVVSPW